MDNITQLLIRACKRTDSQDRLFRVYKRFYYGDAEKTQDGTWAIASILAPIVEMYCPIRLSKVIAEMNPYSMYNARQTYPEIVLRILITQIAYTSAKDFHGLKQPAWLRNRSR
jgi:hypothetical protein